MTKTVKKGAGRPKAAARKKKHDQRDVVVGAKRTEALKAAAKPPRKRPAKKSVKTTKAPILGDGWDESADLGANVARLRENGVTWRGCADLANANGHAVPWPDGGRLLRAMKKHLNGDPVPKSGGPRKQTKKAGKTPITTEDVKASGKTREQLAADIANDIERDVPWDSESTDKELLAYLEGHTITLVSRITGLTESVKILKDGRYTKIGTGLNGKYIEFNEAGGPFRAVSLDMIVSVA